MKKILKLVFVFTLIISCNTDENLEKINNCNTENPLEDLSWLKTKKESLDKAISATRVSIYQYTYNNESVFLIDDCMSCADALTNVYNCNGEKICEFGGIEGRNTCPDFQDKAINKKLLWRNYNHVIIDKDKYDTVETDNYEIRDVSVKENILYITISSSGCDGSTWNLNLVDSGDVMESTPPKRQAKLELINNELCKAIVEKKFQYEISKLQIKDTNELELIIKKYKDQIKYKY